MVPCFSAQLGPPLFSLSLSLSIAQAQAGAVAVRLEEASEGRASFYKGKYHLNSRKLGKEQPPTVTATATPGYRCKGRKGNHLNPVVLCVRNFATATSTSTSTHSLRERERDVQPKFSFFLSLSLTGQIRFHLVKV